MKLHKKEWKKFNTKIQTNITIPAYTSHGQGYKAYIELEAIPSNKLSILTIGNIADALNMIFNRAIEILVSVNPAWQVLQNFAYKLHSQENLYRVRDARSAGVPIAISLLNIIRATEGKPQIDSLIGTGILRVDGSFDASSYEHIKEEVSQTKSHVFINSKLCSHVLDLADILSVGLKHCAKVA